jgi:hypothetical protein
MLLPMAVLAALCVVFGVFAFRLPLGRMIFPIVQVDIAGVWWSGMATILIALAVLAGLILYLLTMRGGRLRRVRTYIGGEQMQDVYISGDQGGSERHVEVTGVEFYYTIEKLPGLQRFYVLMRQRAFDIYDLLKRGSEYAVQMLRALHTGILPVYLRWFVAGLVVVVWVVTETGS